MVFRNVYTVYVKLKNHLRGAEQTVYAKFLNTMLKEQCGANADVVGRDDRAKKILTRSYQHILSVQNHVHHHTTYNIHCICFPQKTAKLHSQNIDLEPIPTEHHTCRL